ncbi:peptidoglycan recognition protein family protein [Paenibacillus polymyxa]|uniref:peptidoglycan recognition protein family protein n=1 Tax=Paenibacillus polymyxa TaxID=1406 RepID=UPI001C9D9638|nr:peptidoglycan recognition family protein [Paenibacillus polymyxa]MBY7736266.1 peptidoglycan recognition protein family protein [Paenibacillus polymyxa]UMR33660.1 peptidoglycan recognition protein family protein [Paenibacillus polymyxa]
MFDTKKYTIERRYINKRHNVRPGTRLTSGAPVFLVAHDTGNPGASADKHYTYFNGLVDRSASAQTFIDDKKILEIIPTGTGPDRAEKAWHVLYNVTTDNERFGDDANDIALGVELCFGGKIDTLEAYKRFVWYLAYCCNKWGINPRTHIPSHKQLDPARKRDVDQALATIGKTLKELVYDVETELKGASVAPAALDFTPLPVYIVQSLIDNYVSPAWFASQKAGDDVGKTHFHNLANNLRAAAGLNEKDLPLAGAVKLYKSNAQEIIFRWLQPAWFKAKQAGDKEQMQHNNNSANYLRRAAGLPTQ